MARLNLLAPEVLADPHSFLAELRRSTPVCQVDPNGAWVITRYDDVLAALKDTRRFSSEGLVQVTQPPWLGPNPVVRSLLTMEPERHGKLRALVNRAFGATGMSRLEAFVRQQAGELAASVARRRKVDFMQELAFALPRSVIGHLLGLDPAVYPKLRRWGTAIATISGTRTPEAQAETRAAFAEMTRHVDEVIEARRREPREDLVSDLLRAEVDGQRLTHEDVVSFLFLLLPAGLETTTNLLGNTAVLLSRYPEELQKAHADKEYVPRIVEEVLRFETPVRAVCRLANTDIEMRGATIPRGALVFLMLIAANRDERQFPEPDRFLPERETQSHLAFGYGIHYCLGAQLARMEARLALETLLPRIQGIHLQQPQIRWQPSVSVRGPVELPVELVPA